MAKRIAVVTDSNSGITQAMAKELGVYVLPMPFVIDGETYFEDISLSQAAFYEKLHGDADISTSQPAAGDVLALCGKGHEDYQVIDGVTIYLDEHRIVREWLERKGLDKA